MTDNKDKTTLNPTTLNIITPKKAFQRKVKNLGKTERNKIKQFIALFQQGGFQAIDNHFIGGYKVRNKSSGNVHKDDPQFIAKVKYAQKYKLWHFHAGFYDLDCDIEGYKLSEQGDLTSQWVIHYQKHSDHHISVVTLGSHPPMILPQENDIVQ